MEKKTSIGFSDKSSVGSEKGIYWSEFWHGKIFKRNKNVGLFK